MRNLADRISARLLPQVQAPSQYVGLEHNRRCGDVASAEVAVALAFPEAYTVGISHLGLQILYNVLNDLPGVAADRTYCPLPDAEAAMRAEGIALFGWESRCALAEFDVLGFSVGYELLATNMLTMLDLAGVPLRAEDRDARHPLVVVGDSAADNPELLALFADVLIVGDGERPIAQLAEVVRAGKRIGASRDDTLREIARQVESAYVPRFYQPRYAETGQLLELARTCDDAPATVERCCVPLGESPAVTAPLAPVSEGVFDRVSIEVMRGCPNNCRFCHAGYAKKPIRWRTAQEVLDITRRAVAATGCDEISLLSLSTSDHPQLAEMIRLLDAEFTPRHVSINLPSLRVGEQLKHLPESIAGVRKGAMTIAAEVGSERLRRAIDKRISDDDLVDGVAAAYQAGWKSVKVYFMAGFPGETEADLVAIVDLCKRLSAARKPIAGHPGGVTASVSWLVPKPHTPLQWAEQVEMDYCFDVRRLLKDQAMRSPVQVKTHRIERSLLEGVLSRGDRRVGEAIEAAWRLGARFDSWDEYFRFELWQQAFEQAGVAPAWYAHRRREIREPQPWDIVTGHVSRENLARQWQDYLAIVAGGPDR